MTIFSWNSTGRSSLEKALHILHPLGEQYHAARLAGSDSYGDYPPTVDPWAIKFCKSNAPRTEGHFQLNMGRAGSYTNPDLNLQLLAAKYILTVASFVKDFKYMANCPVDSSIWKTARKELIDEFHFDPGEVKYTEG